MSERWAIVMAAAAGAGALVAWELHWLLLVVVVAAGICTWRPLVVVAAVFVACSVLGARAEAGLAPPPRTAVAGWVTLITDPREAFSGAWRVDVDLDGRRLQAWARGQPVAALRHRLAGEQVRLQGTVSPQAGRLSVDAVTAHRSGAVHTRVANGIRRTLTRGAQPLSGEDRSLLAGFVLGDDRDQSPGLADDFRGSGLTHLLAVSGQNVAFVLLLAAPALRLLPARGRVLAAVAVLVVFGTVTRWEPSVIRAVAMAAVGIWATQRGTPASSRRTLALAVTALLLVDPLLVRSVGFLLSVGACLGIAMLGGPLSRRLPGPAWVRLPAAVTISAQAGVSPILIPVFGGVPLASLPANLLAAPAAGPVMVWGLAAGAVAGVLGPPFDGILHAPTGLLLGWVRWVASTCAGLPLGELGTIHAAVLGLAALLAWQRPRLLRPALGVAIVVALQPAWSLARGGDLDGAPVARDAWLWRRGEATVLVVHGAPHAGSLLEGLRRRGVDRIDVVVVSGRSSLATLDALRSRHAVRRIAAPDDAAISGAAPISVGDALHAGGLRLAVEQVSPRLRLASDVHDRAHEDGQ